MATDLRIASLNLRAYPDPSRDQIHRLAALLAEHECDVLLLQECLRPWFDVVCEAAGMRGIHAHQCSPEVPAPEFSPDGCAIAVRDPIELRRCWRLQPDSFLPASVQEAIFEEPPVGFEPMPQRLAYRSSGRSALAELSVGGETIVVGSFHATPGAGKVGGVSVGEWKPFFHGAVAMELARVEVPFAFGIDANEPRWESPDRVAFHWEDGRSGSEKLQALLGLEPIHRGRDLFREWLGVTGGEPASPEAMIATYAPRATFQRRFDSIWATPDFALLDFATYLEEAVAAGGDHALLVADLRLGEPYDDPARLEA